MLYLGAFLYTWNELYDKFYMVSWRGAHDIKIQNKTQKVQFFVLVPVNYRFDKYYIRLEGCQIIDFQTNNTPASSHWWYKLATLETLYAHRIITWTLITNFKQNFHLKHTPVCQENLTVGACFALLTWRVTGFLLFYSPVNALETV